QPAVDVVGPGTDAAAEFAAHPAGDKFFHGATFGDRTQLHLPVIVGNGDIARVAHNVDDAPVVGFEALVTLEHTRAGQAAQNPVGGLVHIGNQSFDIEEGDGLVWIHEIADQETRPGVAGARVGSEKNVVIENGDFALQQRAAKQYVVNPR